MLRRIKRPSIFLAETFGPQADELFNPHTTHFFGLAAVAAIGAAGSIAGAAIQSGGSGAAAGIQSQVSQQAIDELRASLTPSLRALGDAQGWSDNFLRQLMNQGIRETRPYANTGTQALGRLNQLMGLGNPNAVRPTAPKAPKKPAALKPPTYDKDPKKAAAQKAQYQQAVKAQDKAYQKALRVYDRANTTFGTDSAAFDAAQQAYSSDPSFGSLMKPYDDRFEGQIDEVARRGYNDKYAPEILEVGRDKFDAADFEADPGYEFRRSEGGRGIEQSAAAGGGLQSGAALKALTRFNQDTASNEFDRAHGRWADVRDTRLNTLGGQQRFDYGVFGDQKAGELGSLVDRRNFDFGNWQGNRDFQTNALTGMVGVGQGAVDDRNALRVGLGGQRSQNRINAAQFEANLRAQNEQQIVELMTGGANAQAAGAVAQGNALSDGIQGAGNALATGLGSYFGGYGRRGGGLVHRSPAQY